MNLNKNVRFELNAMNAVKKKLLSGEKFLFNAYAVKKNSPLKMLKRCKKIFHRYQKNALKKISAIRMPWKINFQRYEDPVKKIFTAKFNAYFILTGNIIEVSDRRGSGKRSRR